MSLTEDQLDRALAHIDYPRAKHAADPLRRLHQLMLHHLARVPFENVGIHYSKTHILSLALDDLFDKIVVRSKGGYCVELNAFFAAILRGLGYKVLTVAGRVKHGDTYSGWSHMCLIVTIDGAKYVADVGFGGEAALRPMPLIHGQEFPILAPKRGRLEFRSLEQSTEPSDPSQRVWVYSARDTLDDNDDSIPWVGKNSFTELECFANDYRAMNYYSNTSPSSFFTPQLIAFRAVLEKDADSDEEGDVKLVGVLTFWANEVRERREGSMEKKVLQTVSTEKERVDALEKYFMIQMSEEDRQGIYTTQVPLALDK